MFAVLHRLGGAAHKLAYRVLDLRRIFESDLMPGPTVTCEHGFAVKAAIGLKACDLYPVFLTMQMGDLLAVHEGNSVHVLRDWLLLYGSSVERQ